MGAAAHIGRVGGLAVALGVGTAVVTGQGVAVADDGAAGSASSASSDSTGSPSATSGTAGSATGPVPSTNTTSTKTTTSRSTGAGTPEPSGSTPSGTSTTSDTVAPGVVVSAQTTTGTSGSTAATKAPGTPESTSLPTEPTPTATPQPTTTAPEPTGADGSGEAPVTPTEVPIPVETPIPAGGSGSLSGAKLTANPTVPVAPVASVSDPGPATLPQNKSVTLAVPKISAASSASTMSSLLAQVSAPAPAPQSATVARIADVPPAPAVASRNPLTIVANVVSSVMNWVMGPVVGTDPTVPSETPLGWTLLAFVRREFENFVSAVGTRTSTPTTLAAETTSLALAARPLAAAAVAAVNVPAFPVPGAQPSPSTSFVNWVTGNYQTGNPLMADTANRFGIWGTDVGVAWDNGMIDDPTTPYNEHQILMAFGDTFSGPNMTGVWRFNTLLRSSDTNLANGIDVPNGEWFNGNMFGGAPLSNPTFARPIINPAPGLPTGVTLIPTAGISVPTPGTQFGVTQYVNFMSVSQWGAAGSWTTNYSAIAYSTDNGENFTVAPSSIRYNQPWGGNQNFQQGAFVRPGDGHVYNYGTPNGRQGAAYVSRVAEKDILDVTKYEYYSKGAAGGWFGIGATAPGWYQNNPGAATAVFGAEGGACGATAAGNTVSEMSVQYNNQLKKYVTLYGDQNNSIVMRTSDTPQGGWSAAKVLMTQQPGGIYAPMMIPSSPSTMGTGNDLYWNLSLYSEYNVMLMRTDLTKV